MKVFCYYNLRKHCFSIKALEGKNKGRVIQHSNELYLKDCIFKVSKSGRARVLKEKRKNVHAGVIGTLCKNVLNLTKTASYNPYKYGYFYDVKTNEAVFSSNFVKLSNRCVIYA